MANRGFATLVATANAAQSALALLAPDEFGLIGCLVAVSVASLLVLCLHERHNLLFLARTFILGAIGYFPILVKIWRGPDALFSAYEPSTQAFSITVIMYVTTSFALLSNHIGLGLARRHRPDQPVIPPPVQTFSYWRLAALLGVCMAVFSSFMFVRGYGESVLSAGYGDERGGKGLPFGSVGILGSMGLFALFVAGMKGHVRHWQWVFVPVAILFIVYSQLLMGVRQDAMSTLFGLVILYGVAKGRELSLRLSYVPLIAVAYVFFEVWGVAREALAGGVPISSLITLTFMAVDSGDAVKLGTISPIALTFANTVYMLDHGMIQHSYGRSYWEWLLRIPPQVLYPDRPKDYALMFENHGLMSGGGFFELAEVYMNFGLLGALVIPGVISYILARVFYFTLRRQSMLSYFVLFAFLAVFLRGTWYQTFAFFRAEMVCLIAYVVCVAVVQFVKLATRKEGGPPHQRAWFAGLSTRGIAARRNE
jgi:hypothetical protein